MGTMSSPSVPSVTLVMRHDGGLVGGGGEVQALTTLDQLSARGVRAELLTPTTQNVGDVAHFFGCFDYFADTLELLTDRGVPCVTSSIWFRPKPVSQVKFDAVLKRLGGTYPRKARRLFHGSKLVLTPSRAVDERLIAFFGLPQSRLFRVPSAGVDDALMGATGDLFRSTYGIEDDFVLHVGMLTHRKNQLGLIRALKGTGKRMVFLGRQIQPDYARQCREEAAGQAVFLEPVPASSPLIGSAYAAARVVCIPSLLEDYLIAGIEAAFAGAQLVLSHNWSPQELYGNHALYPDAQRPESIRQAVEAAWSAQHDRAAQQAWFHQRYSWDVVCAGLLDAYSRAAG